MNSRALRHRLMVMIGGPLLLLLALEAVVTYRISLGNSNKVFDSWLVDSAQSLSRQLETIDGRTQFTASPRSIELFKWDELDEVYFRITSADGELIAGNDRLLAAGAWVETAPGPTFRDQLYQGSQIRTASVMVLTEQGDEVVITVGETLRKRNAMVSELLTEALVPKTVLLLAILPAAWFAIGHGLRAISDLNIELARRSPNDLTPVQVQNAPQEVDTLTSSINGLLGRIDNTISNQEQFLGNIGHQMRTPLAGIKLHAQLAEREDINENVRSALQYISDASDKMTRISNKLLKLAEAETASGRGLREEPVDLVDLAEDCISGHVRAAKLRNVQIKLMAPHESVRVQGDRTLLMELLSNLVDNAIQYGRDNGCVSVIVGEHRGQVQLSVEDDGPGIDARDWPRVFDRFTRLSSTRNPDGSGLGLAIVREIARAHGTEPVLEIPKAGCGIRITVTFPVDLQATTSSGRF